MVFAEKFVWPVLEPTFGIGLSSEPDLEGEILLKEGWSTSIEMKDKIILGPFAFSQMHLEYFKGVAAVHSWVNLAN